MSVADDIARLASSVKPAKFDRAVMANDTLEVFRRTVPKARPGWNALLGLPVFVDESLEPGIVELRLGDEVVEEVDVR